jgi:hypothetical protein
MTGATGAMTGATGETTGATGETTGATGETTAATGGVAGLDCSGNSELDDQRPAAGDAGDRPRRPGSAGSPPLPAWRPRPVLLARSYG